MVHEWGMLPTCQSVWAEAGLRCLRVWVEKDEWLVQKENDFVFLPKSKPAIAPGHDSQHKLWHMWFFFSNSQALLWWFGLLVFWLQILRGKAKRTICGPNESKDPKGKNVLISLVLMYLLSRFKANLWKRNVNWALFVVKQINKKCLAEEKKYF